MLLANMNWLDALCKKLAGVKSCVIVKKVNICRGTAWGWGGRFFWRVVDMNWLGALCEKLAGVKGCVMVKKSIFFWG